ncbi:hypothetical protein [Solibacillus sp.]|uniref:hypothetical protein n=1 Tax=Solibacillus sp. TaxID=1909654 RepID=UPI0033151B6F
MISKIQSHLKNTPYEELQQFHINHLAAVGLSTHNVQLLHTIGITYKDLDSFKLAEFLKRTNQESRESTYHRIMQAYQQLEALFSKEIQPLAKPSEYDLEFSQELEKETLLEHYLDTLAPAEKFTEQELLEAIPLLVKEDISFFLKYDLLFKEGLWYRKKYKNLDVYINTLTQLKHFEVLEGRLAGKTLQELANEHNVTRQSISNREKTFLNKIPFTEEEARYKEFFENFFISKELFCDLFDEPATIFEFLTLRLKKGDGDLLQKINDYPFTPKQKSAILRYNKGIITHKNEIVPLTKLAVFEDVLFIHGKNTTSDELIFTKYNEHILKNNYDTALAEKPSELRGLHERSIYALQDKSHNYRYFDFELLNENDIDQLKDMLYLPNGIYSMHKIFNDYRDFLISINIQNGYELHNLYRRFIPVKNVTYTRMPEFSVGHIDKFDFILHLFHEQAPIHIDHFLDYVYDMYGLKKTSLRSFIQSELFEYIDDDLIKVQYVPLSDQELDYLKRLIDADIHTIEEIVAIGSRDYSDFADRFINNMMLNKIGYSIRSQFILTNDYRSVERYFTDLILSKDYFINERLPVHRTQSFSKVIYDLEKELKIFKIEHDTYITLPKLESVGITTDHIVDFQQQVKFASEDFEYFTLDMLKAKGFTHPLLELGFESIFYDRILWADPEFQAVTLNAGYIFIIQQEDVTLSIFLKWLINHYDSIEAYDLMNEIKQTYHLEIELSKIIALLQNTDIYYSPELMKFYSDKNVYFDEVYN